eukprot:3361112-Pleurochrysis_carterae.AAC.2
MRSKGTRCPTKVIEDAMSTNLKMDDVDGFTDEANSIDTGLRCTVNYNIYYKLITIVSDSWHMYSSGLILISCCLAAAAISL